MVKFTNEIAKRCARWILLETSPAPLPMLHPVRDDMAAAADEIDRLQKLIPNEPQASSAGNASEENIAEIVYDAFPYRNGDSRHEGKPSWVPGGNSLMQDRARQAARAIIALSRHINVSPQAAREMWAMLYLHDWDPPKEGQEHRWEPGKNVFPQIHNVYETWQEAETLRKRMSTPEKYWVCRVRMPAHDALALSRPDLARGGK